MIPVIKLLLVDRIAWDELDENTEGDLMSFSYLVTHLLDHKSF